MPLAIAYLDWEKAFHTVNVNKQVILFDETVRNIIWNFITHETVIFDDRDRSWITSRINKMIEDKYLAFKRFVKNKSFVNISSNRERFSSLQNKLSSLKETLKQDSFSKIAKKVIRS